MISWALVGARLIHFMAAMFLAGSSLCVLVAGGPAPQRWLVRVAAAASLISALAWLVAVTGAMSDRPLTAIDARTLRLVLTETAFGEVWKVQLLLAAALVAAVVTCWNGRKKQVTVVLFLASGLLTGAATAGHAGMAGGVDGLLRTANYALHLIAGAAWLGGLVPLALLLKRAAGTCEPVSPVAARTVERFSALAIAAVAALLLTGATNVEWLLGSFAGIASPWGRVLMVKLALVAALLTLAAANRLILLPRLRANGAVEQRAALAALRRTVLLEQGLAILVLAAASLLGTLPPPLGVAAH